MLSLAGVTGSGGPAPETKSAAASVADSADVGSSRDSGLGAAAERATVTVFGAVGEGSRFVYLFDHSTSMTARRSRRPSSSSSPAWRRSQASTSSR